ncbi:L-histidine N(alpha)-methyltransferase [Streptomyces sp. NPDC048825]|uniref:L-histidine N(alpha)-methyltransferase n=1 Tax=Streptomyces sp. NPDC048825 TaxID=3365592 RepID=UPI0037224478
MTGTRAYGYTDTLDAEHYAKALRADIRAGLTSTPKSTAPTWFYDARGSELFEEITQLPEYPLWRAELGLLQLHARDVAAQTGARSMVELGSGSSTKSKLIIEALRPTDLNYVPVDVSADALHQASAQLVQDYPGIRLHALRADFTAPLVLPALPEDGPRLIAFLGSTLGNFRRPARGPFLRGLRNIMRPEDFLLIGADLVKTEHEMTAAYDDAQGITAELCGSFILSVVRTARPTCVPKPRQRSRIGNGRTRPAPRPRRSSRAPSGPVVGRVPAAAGVARSTRKLRSRHSADVASTEERHA